MGFTLQMEPSLARLPELRSGLRSWLTEADVAEEATEDIVLACWEAAANAVEHPVHPTGDVRIDVERHHDRVVVSVADTGVWQVRETPRFERGLGLRLVSALMDEVQVVPTPDGTRVLMWRCLPKKSIDRQRERPDSRLPKRSA
jgi:anti-sigma regulatory factor (Ser/Thr protein kinase)